MRPLHLQEVIQIGQEAAGYAMANKPAEMEYYASVVLFYRLTVSIPPDPCHTTC